MVFHFFSLFYHDLKGHPWLDLNQLYLQILETDVRWVAPVLSPENTRQHAYETSFVDFFFPGILAVRKEEIDEWIYDSDFMERKKVVWDEIAPEQLEEELIQNASEAEDKREITEAIVEEEEKQSTTESPDKKMVYSSEQLHDEAFVKEHFFNVDPTTSVTSEQLKYENLLGYDESIEKSSDSSKPQILIYHTHSKETYINSNPSDLHTTIVGIGERLAWILQNQYGYQVLHHTVSYDSESRDYAYANAARGLQKVLEEYPSIEVIIDLHRDAVKEDTRLIYEENDTIMARFMFFNGMSYTNAVGKLESLPNPYLQENMAFAFQCMLAAEESFPGITRKTYLKGYRYNMQYRPKSLLIEVGAQTNTFEEAYRTCTPLAHVINLVLSGEYPEKEKLQ